MLAQVAQAQQALEKKGITIAKVSTPVKYVDKNKNNFPDRFEKPVKLSKEDLEILNFVYKAADKKRSFGKRLQAFFSATNKAGRWAKVAKDFALLFIPFGKQVETVTEFVTETFIKEKTMRQEAKKPTKSKTVITFGLLFVAGLLMAFNVIPEGTVSLSPDAEWLTVALGVVGVVLRFFTKQPVSIKAE